MDKCMQKSKHKSDDTSSVSLCIEDLHTLYYLFRNEIWSLNPKLLIHVAPTVYMLYSATACSVYYLKSKLEDLVYLILVHFSNCKDHLKLIIFPQYQIDIRFNDNCSDIQIMYIDRKHQLNLEDQADMVLNILDKRKDLKLMKTMFLTSLDMYADMSTNEYSVMEKLFIVKTINHLIEKNDVQKSISKDPEIVLNLVKSILKDMSKNNMIDVHVLSITLMILGCILENIDNKCANQLDCILNYLLAISDKVNDVVFKEMILEIELKIKQIQNISLEEPADNLRTIDDILFDTRDPLLPCRSHALIELKKKIESGDKMVLAKKSAILIIIQVPYSCTLNI